MLKSIVNAVLTEVGEFKARTSILDRILNAKQLTGSRESVLGPGAGVGKGSVFNARLTVF